MGEKNRKIKHKLYLNSFSSFLQIIHSSKMDKKRYSGKTCRLLSMLTLTSFFFLVEIVVGYLTNSLALVADSFHMLSDVVALVVGFASVRVSKTKFPFVLINILILPTSSLFFIGLNLKKTRLKDPKFIRQFCLNQPVFHFPLSCFYLFIFKQQLRSF